MTKEKYLTLVNLKICMDKGSRLRKLRNAKWLFPGWVGFEYYKLCKNGGIKKSRCWENGVKAEAMRFSALTVPLPGVYETATLTMYLLKNKLEKKDINELKFRLLKDEIKKNENIRYRIGKYYKLRKPVYKRNSTKVKNFRNKINQEKFF